MERGRDIWIRAVWASCIILASARVDAGPAEFEHAPDPAVLSSTVEIGDVLRLTAEGNPEVQASRELWEAARQKRPQVTSLPDPRLAYTDWLRMMEPADERSMIEISQTVPLPRKLELAGRVADRESEIAYLAYRIALRDAFADAKEVFFELYYLDRATTITGEIGGLYERYTLLAAGGVERGLTSLPEVFRGESQRAQLSYDVIQLTNMRRTEEERLRSVLGLIDPLRFGPTAEVADPTGDPPPFEELRDLARAHSQELAQAGLEIRKAGEQVRLAKLQTVPDLMVAARYGRTGGEDVPAGDPTRDPVSLMVGVNLPIWADKYQAIRREARARERAAQHQHRARDVRIGSDLSRAYLGLTTSLRLARLYRQTLLPQARQALRSAEQLARGGEANMFSVLETTATVHNFELAALRATVDVYQNMARIERIIGTALPIRVRGPDPGPTSGAAPGGGQP